MNTIMNGAAAPETSGTLYCVAFSWEAMPTAL
jgi:hypothetical protein